MRPIAKFNGFRCDSCGEVVDTVDRTRKVVTFHRPGDLIPDSYEQDLCGSCAPSTDEMAGTMREVKKRKSKTHAE